MDAAHLTLYVYVSFNNSVVNFANVFDTVGETKNEIYLSVYVKGSCLNSFINLI